MINEKVIGNYAFIPQNQQIGSGQFSNVYKGYNIHSQEVVAIKQIEKKSVQGVFKTMLKNEIEILKKVNHKYILKLHDFYETPNNFYFVTDYCETDILEIIKQKQHLSEAQAKLFILQIAEALKYLHSLNIIHRDIKPPNILIKGREVRLADFGFAQTYHHRTSQQQEMGQFQIGSPLYMAPETILRNIYDEKTDVWALGVLLFEMVFGTVPFFSMHLEELVDKIKKYQGDHTLSFPRKISPQITDAIRNLLAYSPEHRCDLLQLRKILTDLQRTNLSSSIRPIKISKRRSARESHSKTERCDKTQSMSIYENGLDKKQLEILQMVDKSSLEKEEANELKQNLLAGNLEQLKVRVELIKDTELRTALESYLEKLGKSKESTSSIL